LMTRCRTENGRSPIVGSLCSRAVCV
jgi:hypothetical protein